MKYIANVLFLFLGSMAWAQESGALLAQYAQQISQVKTLQSNFVEEKHL